MGYEKRKHLSLYLVSLLFVTIIIPAYGEVQSLQSDKTFYVKGDKIIFSGFVEDHDTGLVTIVIRDPTDEFVLLTQALINPDNSYEKSITINEKFTISGIYNATAFVFNMTSGEVIRFDYSPEGSPISPSVSDTQVTTPPPPEQQQITQPTKEEKITNDNTSQSASKFAFFVDYTKDPQYYIDRYYNEATYKDWFDRNFPDLTIEAAVGILPKPQSTSQTTKIPGFPDPEKDPQYYIERYQDEVAYRDWFDRTFPDQTIYEIVGVPEPSELQEPIVNSTTKKSITLEETTEPDTIFSSGTRSSSNEFSQLVLALGGLGVLFGAVYGIKRKVDHNSEKITENHTKLGKKVTNNAEQISQNRFWIKRKLFNLRTSDEPIKIIKDRLAKGEITVEQYYKLLRAIKKN